MYVLYYNLILKNNKNLRNRVDFKVIGILCLRMREFREGFDRDISSVLCVIFIIC